MNRRRSRNGLGTGGGVLMEAAWADWSSGVTDCLTCNSMYRTLIVLVRKRRPTRANAGGTDQHHSRASSGDVITGKQTNKQEAQGGCFEEGSPEDHRASGLHPKAPPHAFVYRAPKQSQMGAAACPPPPRWRPAPGASTPRLPLCPLVSGREPRGHRLVLSFAPTALGPTHESAAAPGAAGAGAGVGGSIG